MKNVLFLLGALSIVGCAVGSNDPTGDETLGTDQGGEATGQPTGGSGAAAGDTNANDKATSAFAHTNQFDPAPQVVPNRQGHGPAAPGPGPVHGGGPR